jgi:type II secretory pathway pseudopilin PulG
MSRTIKFNNILKALPLDKGEVGGGQLADPPAGEAGRRSDFFTPPSLAPLGSPPLIKGRSLDACGFTLLETLITIGIFVTASVVLWAFIVNGYKSQNFSLDQSAAITEAQRGVETFVKELREALPGDNGAYPIEIADAQNLIFYADFDRDNAIEKVHYWLDGSNLKKGVTEAAGSPLTYNPNNEQVEILSRYVRNEAEPVFTYRDGDYNELAAPADAVDVKLIHIYLRIDLYPQKAPTNYDLESDVAIRNLKENL